MPVDVFRNILKNYNHFLKHCIITDSFPALIMKRRNRKHYFSANGFSPQTNRAVGSFLYTIVFLATFYVSYKIWGTDVFSEIWFWLFNIFAYWFVGAFLRFIGFWKY
ncbi:hypothetical protein COU76_03465 [Candidatus Peregrinibacteria bacterium CG10_big_fil_rev_8_21_14_0_10_49_10]|nr:MAG: hypothetical protein COU76_03465 [Candidatus Peregrinibacteria bacterium CG10_big_fil_rev_8_21_14_0_10_49_10]